MFLLPLLLLLMLSVAGTGAVRYTREFAFGCTEYYTDGVLDGVRDGIATRPEVAKAMHLALGGLLAFFARELNIYTIDKVFRDCDGDRDGYLSHADRAVSPHCMEDQGEIDNAVNYLCKRLSRVGDRYYAHLHAQ